MCNLMQYFEDWIKEYRFTEIDNPAAGFTVPLARYPSLPI